MDGKEIAGIRAFNRTVTERLGALEETYLGGDRQLGETRLLWEIGPEGADVRLLRSRLGLDAGYTSRMLRTLERDDLVSVEPSPDDRRVRRARLTPRGRAERRRLDRRADELVESMLEPLDERQRERLVAAARERGPAARVDDRDPRRRPERARGAMVHLPLRRRAGRAVRGRVRSRPQPAGAGR